MKRARFALGALILLALCRTASAQVVLYREDFENGFGDWTMTGLWNPENAQDACGVLLPKFPSGKHCAYYGIDGVCNYNTPANNSGSMTWLQKVEIPSLGRVSLRIWDWREAECYCQGCPDAFISSYDRTQIYVSVDDGGSWEYLGASCAHGYPQPQPLASNTWWQPRDYDLSAYLGQKVYFRFSFATIDSFANAFFGWAIDDVSILQDTSTTVCVPTMNSCPCANLPFWYEWPSCPNSTREMSELLATGNTAVGQDSLVLEARHLPANTAVLFMQGFGTTNGAVFGDGRLCVSGPFCRLGVQAAPHGNASFPEAGQPSISSLGAVPVGGGTRAYQAYYRDSASFCTSATFNVTSAFQLAWTP